MDESAKLGLATCCRAVAGMPVGLARPRRVDQALLAGLVHHPAPTGPVTVDLIALPQRRRAVPTAAIVEGVRRPRRVDNALTSFVVRHPDATFLVDPGTCVDVVDRAVAELPALMRAVVTPPFEVLDVGRALELAAIDRRDVEFALVTHLHWDHVAGLLDLPDLPLHLHSAERDWALTGPVAPVGGVRPAVRGRALHAFDLDGPPVLTFSRSHDLFGDGSVVLVDLAGHTPGSVGVLLRTPTGLALLAGDAVWHHLQLDAGRQKPSFPGLLVDEDRDETWRTLHRLIAVRSEVHVVPTHDSDASQRYQTVPLD